MIRTIIFMACPLLLLVWRIRVDEVHDRVSIIYCQASIIGGHYLLEVIITGQYYFTFTIRTSRPELRQTYISIRGNNLLISYEATKCYLVEVYILPYVYIHMYITLRGDNLLPRRSS